MHTNVRNITVNQLGYPIDGKKVAILSDMGGPYQLINKDTNQIVFQGEATGPKEDTVSGKSLYYANFSEVKERGTYYIRHDDFISSTFRISESPYNELHSALLKGFYFLRCGMKLEESFAGPWHHKECHVKEAIVYGEEDRLIETSGGWHDAGDYGKYIVPGAKAVADLLLAFELYPNAFQAEIPIPETDHQTPDVLHECRYELEWMLKMQDERSGGVYHKLTTQDFPGLDVMPEDDLANLFLSPISATATASFSAVMAMASRVYSSIDGSFSSKCLQAAKMAWEWLHHHPSVAGFKNPSSITTGEYGDERDIDVRYWASAELYRTTGDKVFHHSFIKFFREDFPKFSFGWADNGGYGTIAYLLNSEFPIDEKLYKELKDGLSKEAQRLAEISRQDGYFVSLKSENYIWGSNMIVMNHAMVLLLATYFSGKRDWSTIALDHVHYLLGRNVVDISYVTGFGDKSIQHPHHRPSVGDGVEEPVPGYVSGGPNKNLQDEIAVQLKGKPPAQCFLDHQDSYSMNEITIYWNSPAVFVLSHWKK